MQGNRNKKVMWIIDSECSRHMTSDKALLSQFKMKVGLIVTFGDNNKGFIMGYGNLVVGNVVIEDITLLEGLKTNLLSVSQFNDIGFNVEIRRDVCSINFRKTGKLDFKGVRKGSLFVADMSTVE